MLKDPAINGWDSIFMLNIELKHYIIINLLYFLAVGVSMIVVIIKDLRFKTAPVAATSKDATSTKEETSKGTLVRLALIGISPMIFRLPLIGRQNRHRNKIPF